MKVHELLSDKSKWTQHAYVRDADGRTDIPVGSENAVCWCLVGAVMRCYADYEERKAVRRRIDDELQIQDLEWNDQPSRTFADVRDLVTRLDI